VSAPARALDHEGRARRPGLGGAVAAYVALTKPRIIELLLVTTVPAMVLAEEGLPTLWLVAATLIGGTLAAGGANAINQYVDRDIDEVMRRTRRRPLPSHTLSPSRALAFGIALGAAGFVWLAVFVNLLSAALATAGLLFYVFVYTLWLKRRSVQNIVVGGAAGAVPALVGWAAVTGRVGWPAVVLFMVVFLWTPPHFWALALRYERDYAAAGVPMLPVVAGTSATIRQILLYAVATVAASLVLVPVAGMGWVYVASAIGLGAWFLWAAARVRTRPTLPAAMALFRWSISYLALLFLAVAVDALVRGAT
jgi:protoheme IX farnesyltransferase